MINAQLCFPVPPKIQHGNRHIKVHVGQRVDILCNAHGSPPPVITWFKSGRPFLDGAQHPGSPDGTLSIEQAVISDAGVYTCAATNIAGSDEAEVTLHVQGGFWHKNCVWSGEAEEWNETPSPPPPHSPTRSSTGCAVMHPFRAIST